MYTAAVNAGTATPSGFSFFGLAIVVIVLGIAVPLTRRFRRSVSENRKRRWVEEGLMDPPGARPDPSEPSE